MENNDMIKVYEELSQVRNGFSEILNNIKQMNTDLKLKIALDENASNKMVLYAKIDAINEYINQQL